MVEPTDMFKFMSSREMPKRPDHHWTNKKGGRVVLSLPSHLTCHCRPLSGRGQ